MEEDDARSTNEGQPRVILTPIEKQNRTSSNSSPNSDESPNNSSEKGRKKMNDKKGKEEIDENGNNCLETVAKNRKELEKFLFDQSNKINRPAIKYILKKWASMPWSPVPRMR